MAVLLLLVLLVGLVVGLAFLLGFRLGGQSWLGELTRVRSEAAEAERQLHELTRQAFVAMAERLQEHQRRSGHLD